MTKIIEKINEITTDIKAKKELGDITRATHLQDLATKAICGGMDSNDWTEYMSEFASTPEQLKRLKGKDEVFNKTIYGQQTLAYLVANSTCGPGTDTFTGKFMNDQMLEILDADLPEKATETDVTPKTPKAPKKPLTAKKKL